MKPVPPVSKILDEFTRPWGRNPRLAQLSANSIGPLHHAEGADRGCPRDEWLSTVGYRRDEVFQLITKWD